jgi:hypothetical protein
MQQKALFLLIIFGTQSLLHPALQAAEKKRPSHQLPTYWLIDKQQQRLPLAYLTKRQQFLLQHILHTYQHKGLPLDEKASFNWHKILLALFLCVAIGGGIYYAYAATSQPKTTAEPAAPTPAEEEAIPQQAHAQPTATAEANPCPAADSIPASAFPSPPMSSNIDKTLLGKLLEGVCEMQKISDHLETDPEALKALFNLGKQATKPLSRATTDFMYEQAWEENPRDRYHAYGRYDYGHTAYAKPYDHHAFEAQLPRVPTHVPQAPIRVSVPKGDQKTAAKIAERIAVSS